MADELQGSSSFGHDAAISASTSRSSWKLREPLRAGSMWVAIGFRRLDLREPHLEVARLSEHALQCLPRAAGHDIGNAKPGL